MAKNLLYVLVADDDEDDRLFFNDALDELKLQTQVEFVHDGAQLMEYLNQTDILLPDILFLDLNMPKKSGYQCLVEIKENENLKNITIAIYSTSSAEEDVEYTFDKGADFYVKKPNDYHSLRKIISTVLFRNSQDHNGDLSRDNFVIHLNN